MIGWRKGAKSGGGAPAACSAYFSDCRRRSVISARLQSITAFARRKMFKAVAERCCFLCAAESLSGSRCFVVRIDPRLQINPISSQRHKVDLLLGKVIKKGRGERTKEETAAAHSQPANSHFSSQRAAPRVNFSLRCWPPALQ